MMSDPDIQFGEVEELPPQRRRRPDRDRHFAVVDYDAAPEGDLPIFVDADVLADMETHARTDTSVELGGVMLGGQYVDEDGNPFVVVSDSLRAEHYESSRGHFKFTHDTWTRISRQRDEFSDDLQMVGWYHTHPDWGVFLSGMDRFICDNFFNRPLDVALVIDPVRNDRGWFYWKRDGNQQLSRTGGFRVTASRFRRRELAAYVTQLEGKTAMKPDSMFGGAPQGAPGVSTQVIHTIRPQMGWMGIAILAILVVQACLTLLVALRLDGSGGTKDSQPQTGQAASAERQEEPQRPLAVLEERLQREFEFQRRKERLDAERTVFDQLLGKVKVGPDGKLDLRELVEENQLQQKEIERLTKTDFLLAELTERLKQQRDESAVQVGKLEETNAELSRRNERLREQLRQMTESHEEALARVRAARAEIERLESPPSKADGEQITEPDTSSDDAAEESASGDPPRDGWISAWTIAITLGAALVVVVLGAVIVVIIKRKRDSSHRETENTPENNES